MGPYELALGLISLNSHYKSYTGNKDFFTDKATHLERLSKLPEVTQYTHWVP